MILDDFWRKKFSNLINSLPASDAETLTVLVHGRAVGVWGELGLWRKFRTVYLLRWNVNSIEYRSIETSRTRKRVFFFGKSGKYLQVLPNPSHLTILMVQM